MIKSKETVILFGDKSDPEVRESIKHIKKMGRKATVTPRPSFDTGFGPCGRLCHCQTSCMIESKAAIR